MSHLPKELRALVRKVTSLLGETIRTYEGDKFFKLIESCRKELKYFRVSKDRKQLNAIYLKLKQQKKANLLKITHAFSMLLELINVSESAYRTWHQRHKKVKRLSSSKIELNFVLTAHPTEARSNDVVAILRALTKLLVRGMHDDFKFNESEICTQLSLLWHYPMVKTGKTTVLDEAEYIYSNIFTHPIFDFIISDNENYRLNLSTWVGGDKDGHPGITDQTMLQCLAGSRSFLIDEVEFKLSALMPDIDLLKRASKSNLVSKQRLAKLIRQLQPLRRLQHADGRRVEAWKRDYATFLRSASLFVRRHSMVGTVSHIIERFPALVLPLELRENASDIADAISNQSAPIWKMLKAIKRISTGMDMTAYAHGLIISHCQTSADLTNATKLVYAAAGTKKFPVVPLFEDRESLESAANILEMWLDTGKHLKQIKQHWHGRFEIMLGYSDSAKQVGVLPSRYMIRRSMFNIERLLKRRGLTPVFFHGSGGSVARGGGSIEEQIAWWPDSAIQFPKMTIQGEMIQRTFATPEIIHSQGSHLSHEASVRKARKARVGDCPALALFTQCVEEEYVRLVSNTKLLAYCLQATPYKYLSILRLGSRPSSRPEAEVSLESLRAIPWILCWTQTRVLFPTWWGIGTAWHGLSQTDREKLKKFFKSDPFFSSFVKTLGYTLAKVEMPVWGEYLEKIHGRNAEPVYNMFALEYKRAVKFVYDVTQSKKLIRHRPWLEESIRLRSPYVHILNLLQIFAMKTHDEKLLRETLVGIACGMLETG